MKASAFTDDELIELFSQGDKKAFDELFNRFYSQLQYFSWRMIDDIEEAQDIALVSLQILFKRYTDFNALYSIKAFLYITCRNKCLNYLISRKRRKLRLQQLIVPDNEIDDYILAQMVRNEVLQQVYHEVEGLQKTCKAVFKMFYIEELTPEEIAEKLHISVAAVYNSKSKAVKQLRLFFNNDPAGS